VLQLDLGKEGESSAWSSVLMVQVDYVLPGNVLSITLDKHRNYDITIHVHLDVHLLTLVNSNLPRVIWPLTSCNS